MTPTPEGVAVRAAGGLIVRGAADNLEIAVVHRPRYDDWSIPKGKNDPGENEAEAALREVREETGLRCHIIGPLGANRYEVVAGLKQVDYFLMRPYRSDGFEPNEEVDELRWVRVEESTRLLTHAFDAELAAGLDVPAAAAHTAIHLVRHSPAGDRDRWEGPDKARPLTKKGVKQAAAIAAGLAEVGVERVLTSPYVRCQQTVAPLTDLLGVPLETHPALAEGPDRRAVAALLDEIAGTTAVLSSHGDVIPAALELMERAGVHFQSRYACQKGSTWVIGHDGDKYTDAEYIDPPGVD